MQTGVIALPRYCVVPVGEIMVNPVSATFGDTVVWVIRLWVRLSTRPSRPSAVTVVEHPFWSIVGKVLLHLALIIALSASRFASVGSFCRDLMNLLSTPRSLAHFFPAAASRLAPHFASGLLPRSRPSFTAATIAPTAESVRPVAAPAERVVSAQSTPSALDLASAFDQAFARSLAAFASLPSRRVLF